MKCEGRSGGELGFRAPAVSTGKADCSHGTEISHRCDQWESHEPALVHAIRGANGARDLDEDELYTNRSEVPRR